MSETFWLVIVIIIGIPVTIVCVIKFIQFIIGEIEISRDMKRDEKERQEIVRKLNDAAGLGNYPGHNDRLP